MTAPLISTDAPGLMYDIRKDKVLLNQIQNASLSQGNLGLTTEHGVVGTESWWAALHARKIEVVRFDGIIQLDKVPMRDSFVLRVQGVNEVKSWMPWSGFQMQDVGKHIEVIYAKIPPKVQVRPGFLVNLVLQVRRISE